MKDKKQNSNLQQPVTQQPAGGKKKGYQIVIDQITGIFLPVINMITAASIIKSVMILLVTFGVLTTDNGIYRIFYAVSDGFFYFLPFFLAITASKQWKTDLYASIMIPAAMLYPDITAILENGAGFSFLGMNVPHTIYHSSIIPVVLAVGLLHFVEKPCDKWIPEAVRGFMKPIICCIIVLPVTFLVFGPLGSLIGNFLTEVFFKIYNWNSIVAGAFMGFFIQPMVVLGAHWSIVPVCINNIMLYGYDTIMPLLGGAVYGQAGAALAVGMLYKQDKEKRRVAYQAAFTAALGVTEPALYGVNTPLVRPLLAGCLAGAVGGAISGIAQAHCISFAFPSFLTCVAYIGPGFGMFLFSMAIGFPLGFLFTMLQKNRIKL